MLRGFVKIIKLYLSLAPYDRVKTGGGVAFAGALCASIFIFSQWQISDRKVSSALGSSDVMHCNVRIVGKESIEGRSGGRVSVIKFVDERKENGCLLIARGVEKASVKYLNSGVNRRHVFYDGSTVRVYFAKSKAGWRAISVATIDGEVIVGKGEVDGYYELVFFQNAIGLLVSLLMFFFGVALAFVSWFNYLRGVSFDEWGNIINNDAHLRAQIERLQ